MHKIIESTVESVITACALITLMSPVVPALADLPAPVDTKIELISRPSPKGIGS